MGRLNRKIAIVTGAAVGNGWGIAKIFCSEGAQVVMFDIQERVFDSAKEFESMGYKATGYIVDVSNFDTVKKAVNDVAEKFGNIDILVNNAGVARRSPFLEMSDEIRDRLFHVNIIGVWNCTKVVLHYMVPKNYGKVINLSSVTGPMVVDSGQTAYATTKAAIWGFTKALAMEMVGNNINVNMICPGMIDTPMVRAVAARAMPDNPQSVIDAIAAGVPMKRLGLAEEIGQLATFLTSDESAYITGQPFVIDGGSTLAESTLCSYAG